MTATGSKLDPLGLSFLIADGVVGVGEAAGARKAGEAGGASDSEAAGSDGSAGTKIDVDSGDGRDRKSTRLNSSH